MRLLHSRGAKQELRCRTATAGPRCTGQSPPPDHASSRCCAPRRARRKTTDPNDSRTPLAYAIHLGLTACEAVLRAHGRRAGVRLHAAPIRTRRASTDRCRSCAQRKEGAFSECARRLPPLRAHAVPSSSSPHSRVMQLRSFQPKARGARARTPARAHTRRARARERRAQYLLRCELKQRHISVVKPK
jgi:hypothetical protein